MRSRLLCTPYFVHNGYAPLVHIIQQNMLQQLRRIILDENFLLTVLKRREIRKKKIVIDFSSPNLVKTFHMGNLRSTLYGNYMQKLCRLAGHDVVSINYLGDWGHQFALLAAYWKIRRKSGEADWPTDEDWLSMSNDKKVEFLTKIYVKAYSQARVNSDFENQSRILFHHMESLLLSENVNVDNIDDPDIKLWIEFRRMYMQYLEGFYSKFNVQFDRIEGEHEHVAEGLQLVNELIEKKVAFLTEDKLWAIRPQKSLGEGKIALKRSDNTSLYLTRDQRFSADEYVYVVDQSQSGHFSSLKMLLESLGRADLARKIKHVVHGRVIGLSTRQGKNDSVDFLVEQGCEEAKAYIKKSPTIRITDENELNKTSWELARSAIIFDLMKRSKTTDYTFSFKGAFNLGNVNALLLHEKFTRLNSLELVNKSHMDFILNMSDAEERRLKPEMSPTAHALAQKLFEFDTIMSVSLDQLEPCPLTIYLVKLSNQLGKSMAALRVHGEPKEKAIPRLILFSAAKKVLGEGMKLLGFNRIDKM